MTDEKTNVYPFPVDVAWKKLLRESKRLHEDSQILTETYQAVIDEIDEMLEGSDDYEGFIFIVLDDDEPSDN